MRKIGILFVAVLVVMSACKPNYKNVKVKTDIDSVSYLIGISVAKNVKQSGDFESLSPDAFAKGIAEVYAEGKGKDSLKLTDMEIQSKLQGLVMKFEKKNAEKNIKEGAEFLAKNKTVAGVITTASGLQYQVITQGNGAKPDSNDVVNVNYKGTLIDGKVFDSNEGRGPAKLGLKAVFPGFTEALLLMPVGSKYKLFIPSALAYGERGAGQGSMIKGNMALIFEVEVLSIEPKAVPEAPKGKK